MFFDDCSLIDMFHISEYSRYLFLEFIPSFSLVVVANQGSYDLHLFRMTNVMHKTNEGGPKGNRVTLQREYVFKCSRKSERILGVSIIDNSTNEKLANTIRIYIFTSDSRLHCLEVARRLPYTCHIETKKRDSKRKNKVKRHKACNKLLSAADLLY